MPRHTRFVLAIVLLVLNLSAAFDPAVANGPARGVVRVVHDWDSFPALAAQLRGLTLEARADAVQKHYAASGRRLAHGYFAWRGAGDASSGIQDWLAVPPAAIDGIAAALADSAARARLHAGAAELERRLSRVVPPGDTLHLVLLVGGFEEPVLTYDADTTRVVAAQVECFLPGLDAPTREMAAGRALWQPAAPLAAADLFPWCAYAATSVFLPELRERKLGDRASLAEMVLLKGFSARFAGALYPESDFAGGRAPVSESARAAVSREWRAIGARWIPFGTEPYLAAVLEDSVLAAVPEGVTADEAAAVVGSALAGEWLDAARVSRTRDDAAEIARLGRFPTLYAWGLLQP